MSDTVSTTGLPVPDDFNKDAYEAVQAAVREQGERNPDGRVIFSGGWNGLMYRYLACKDYCAAFEDSLRKHETAPLPPERFTQESSLFGFFVSGLSSLECFAFGVHGLGSFVEPDVFGLNDQHSIKLRSVRQLYSRHFSGSKLEGSLGALLRDSRYKEWKLVRDILAHRISPRRTVRVGGPPTDTDTWNVGKFNLELVPELTSSRRDWLADQLSELIQAAAAFSQEFLGEGTR